MGHDTDFEGVLSFTEELTIPQLKRLQELCAVDYRDWECESGFIPEDEYMSYINLKVTKDMDGLVWDGSEKSYCMPDAIRFIIYHMRLEWPDFGLVGIMYWHDDYGERGRIKVEGDQVSNRVEPREVLHRCPHCNENIYDDEV